jgi:hypothetical protein
MAELTIVEEKLAEVLGLAQAAQQATSKVEGLVEDETVVDVLQRMRSEAEETRSSPASARSGTGRSSGSSTRTPGSASSTSS